MKKNKGCEDYHFNKVVIKLKLHLSFSLSDLPVYHPPHKLSFGLEVLIRLKKGVCAVNSAINYQAKTQLPS